MARKYTYSDFKTKKVLFESTKPNHVSEDDVHALFKKKTGRDYRLERGLIDCQIRFVGDPK